MANYSAQTDRRNVLQKLAIGGTIVASGTLAFTGRLLEEAYATGHTRNPYSRPFVVPPLASATRNGNRLHFALDIRQGSTRFYEGIDTPTLGVNGDYLGPVLRARKGDRVSFTVNSHLRQDATLHWHGLKLPARMDGGPHQVIRPGTSWSPEFKLIQPAASYWYHAHTHQLTGFQVYHGLAGMFIVDDEVSDSLGLPDEYGVDDLPVVIQDRAFNRDGSFRYVSSMHDRMRGMLGDTILVNGVVTPTLSAKRSLLRLRLLNGSNARIYNLEFSDQRPFTMIAGDGGFLPRPAVLESLRLAPGERAEVLLDLSDGKEVVLRSQPTGSAGMPGMMSMMMGGGNERLGIMRIVPPSGKDHNKIDLARMHVDLPDWSDKPIMQRRKLTLDMLMGPRMMMGRVAGTPPFSINGQALDMDVINFSVRKSSFEIWELGNNSVLAHPFHIHNTQFRVLARSDRPIPPHESGLKDTVIIDPGERVRLLVPFPDYADEQNPYMYHCHILEHEDGGMMGQFTVKA